MWHVIGLLFIVALFTQYAYPIESTVLLIVVGKDNVVEAHSYLQTICEAMDIEKGLGLSFLVKAKSDVDLIYVKVTLLAKTWRNKQVICHHLLVTQRLLKGKIKTVPPRLLNQNTIRITW